MTQPRPYAPYIPPRRLAWVRWQLRRLPRQAYRCLRKVYRRRWPPPERYIGMKARILERGAKGPLHVGSIGDIDRSEVQNGNRVYFIEFDAENLTLMARLPDPGVVELFTVDPFTA